MHGDGRRVVAYKWLHSHAVEVAFVMVAAGWFWYVGRVTRGTYFWADDLRVIELAGSWGGMIKPYDGALSLTSMLVDRAAAQVGGLSYWPFTLAGAVSLGAVPMSYFFTARRQLGPPLAAILAMPLLWFIGTNLRPAGLNHSCALIGGIVCAAALNRGRRADWILAAALLFALISAGGGLIAVGACLVHCTLVRPHWRRWLAVVAPTAMYGIWWLWASPNTTSPQKLSLSEKVRIVREFFFAPFRQTAFNSGPLAVILLVAFVAWGAWQLRGGLVAGANFVAWTAAMIGWPLALIQSRGATAAPSTFRYAYLSLGFALLAVVPRHPIRWPSRFSVTNRRWLALAAIIVLLLGGARALPSLQSMQRYSTQNVALGERAKGTMLVLSLGPTVIPDSTLLTFFGYGNPHGTAQRARALIARYGLPFHPTFETVDQELVHIGVVRAEIDSYQTRRTCDALTAPVDLASTSIWELPLGSPPVGVRPTPGPARHKLWTKDTLTIYVRRFGNRWVPVTNVPAGHYVFLTLPVLSSETPWQIRADGACVIS